jgi:hypothetical protein
VNIRAQVRKGILIRDGLAAGLAEPHPRLQWTAALTTRLSHNEPLYLTIPPKTWRSKFLASFSFTEQPLLARPIRDDPHHRFSWR